MSENQNGPYQPKPGDIAIFQNKNPKGKNSPLLTGKVHLNLNELQEHADPEGNVQLFVSLWGKQQKDGKPFWAGKANPPQPREEQNTTEQTPPGDFSQADDLPF